MKGTLARPKKPSSQASGTLRSSRTKLGDMLRKIRSDIVASGAVLLDWDALDREIAELSEHRSG